MPHRVFIRVATKVGLGIRSHFTIRVSEWVMTFPAFGMYLALRFQPDMFSMSASFSTLKSWANEPTWAFICMCCGCMRLIALVVNGSFAGFPYSPHMRMSASLIGIVFWSQYSMGFIDAYLNGTGAASAVVAYTTFVAFELVNFWRSNIDRVVAAK